MPSGSMSLASASVPAPPGVFATSMPPDLSSSEERESPTAASERSSISSSLHHSIMVNGSVISPPSGKSLSKSPHFVMVRGEEENTAYKHPNKIRKRNKSGRRSLHSSASSKDGGAEVRYLNGGSQSQSPQYGSLSSGNKPLKVTIRRTALSHTLDSRKPPAPPCNPDHDAYSSSSPSNSVIYSSSSTSSSASHCVLKAAEDDRPLSITPKPSSAHPSLSGATSPSSFNPPAKTTVECAGADMLSSISPSIHSSEPAPKQPPDQPSRRDAATSTKDCATITEPDLLGPCEPGSKIVLEGIVWLETPGMMVVNAHWRGRAYLGTLLDASKNTLGPSCPDKMVSALSLFRGRQNWGSGAGYYRASGGNSCSTNNLYSANIASTSRTGVGAGGTGAGGVGAAMTTRAAAAAAAAAERTGTDEESGSNRSSGGAARRRGGTGGAAGLRGGAKRKRRRGSATHTANATYTCAISPAIKVAASQSPTDAATAAPTAAAAPIPSAPTVAMVPTRTAGVDQCDGRSAEPCPAPPDSQTDPGSARDADQSPFVCPQPGCEKRFTDMVGLRYHLDMGHLRSASSASSVECSTAEKPPPPPPPQQQPQTEPPPVSSDVTQQQQRQPPRLAKAKTESATSLTYADDDQPPPQLDRGPGAEEELGGNEDTTGTDLTEPPAASPAYSDISEDAASPLNHPVIVVDATNTSTAAPSTTVILPGVPLQQSHHRPASTDLYHNGHHQLPPPPPAHTSNTPAIFTAAALAAAVAAKAAGAPCPPSLRMVSGGLPQPPSAMAVSVDGLQRSSPLLLNSGGGGPGGGHNLPNQRVASPSAGNFFLRGGLPVAPEFASSHPQQVLHRSNMQPPPQAGALDFAAQQAAFQNHLAHSDGTGGLTFQSAVRSCLPTGGGIAGMPVGMVPFARLVRPMDGVDPKRFPLCPPSSIASTTTVTVTSDTPNHHLAASAAKTCPLQYMSRQSPPQSAIPPSVQSSPANGGLPFRSQ